MHQDKLSESIEQMRGLGDLLVPYNSPRAPTSNEEEISVLKTRELLVDGYEVVAYYTKSNFETHFTEVFQVYGKNSPFLPFSLICKMAKMFLGNAHLSLVELFRGNRKVYCWAVNVDATGKPIPSPYEMEVEECTYEGFRYSYMQPNQVNFY